jgi:hypothetical protein
MEFQMHDELYRLVKPIAPGRPHKVAPPISYEFLIPGFTHDDMHVLRSPRDVEVIADKWEASEISEKDEVWLDQVMEEWVSKWETVKSLRTARKAATLTKADNMME